MINIDGSYHENKGEGSMGAVIRNSAGTFVAAAHSFIPHALDAATSEAAALRDGLLLAQLIGCTRVEIQSDSVEVVQTMIEGGFSARAGPEGVRTVRPHRASKNRGPPKISML
jgi:ribonuclease HI